MIEIKEINKRFEDVQAVSDLTMKIVEGEIFGLVGTNGAGKSTLMRMIVESSDRMKEKSRWMESRFMKIPK